jgi:regulator of RNase E activity RraA
MSSDDIRERYLKVSTSAISDVLDVMGLMDQALAASFTSMIAGDNRLAGWAYTIQGLLTSYPLTGDPDKMKAIEEMKPDCISVWSGREVEGVCFFGELLARGMKLKGCKGALVDGGVRDLQPIGALTFPVFARYSTPVQSIGRWKVTSWQVPISLPGATGKSVEVNPGDFVLADLDGVLIIPSSKKEEVLERAERLIHDEERVSADIEKGFSLQEVLSKYGHV